MNCGHLLHLLIAILAKMEDHLTLRSRASGTVCKNDGRIAEGGKEIVKERYVLLDSIRGITLLSMILYHGMFDLVEIYGLHVPWFGDRPGYVWQQSICWIFILLSGFCWNLGKGI